ncbi:MAG: hypothetical protein KDE33_17070 [Bacteroidetes bacterium]|nr:hypothetical protein [Bacteroidota bacterium]
MSEFLYASLGYIIIFILVFVTIYGTVLTVKGGKTILGFLIIFAVFFSTIFRVVGNPSCACIYGSDIFRDFTRWFMVDVLGWVGSIFTIFIVIIAANAFFRGERSIAPRILIEAIINLILAFFSGLIFSTIVAFYVCPLICEHYIDWDIANQNIWAAIRRWLGTG